jgi:multifunctional methyltransferase subunit TRM112
MKLFSHNMLTSQMIKAVQVGYPLKLTASEVRVVEQDFQPTFLVKMLPKVNWSVLVDAIQSIGHGESAGLPPTITEDCTKSEDFLKKAHHALFEIEVITGEMECPETGRKFPIQNGVPNMLINEDEC